MDFTEAIPIIISGIFSLGMADMFVLIPPCFESVVDALFIGINQALGFNVGFDEGLNGGLFHVG